MNDIFGSFVFSTAEMTICINNSTTTSFGLFPADDDGFYTTTRNMPLTTTS
jgi:hypothetical protein